MAGVRHDHMTVLRYDLDKFDTDPIALMKAIHKDFGIDAKCVHVFASMHECL